jgi:hypothetical protein
MTPQKISTTVEERIDQAEAADGGLRAAMSAFYDLTAQLERADPEFFGRLDGAWVDCLVAVRRVAWLDGWACGRNPDLLVIGAAQGGE